MKIIIAGAGSVGLSLAKQLIEEKNEVILIEQDEERARNAQNLVDCEIINAPANDLNTLRKANAESADYLIAVTRSDEVNMITCGLAAGVLKTPLTVARISNPEFADTGILNKAISGIDFVVNTEIETARSIVNTIEYGAVSDIIYFEKSRIQVRNLFVTDDSFLRNRDVQTIRSLLPGEFLIAGIVRDGKFFTPEGSTRILEDDNLYIIGEDEVLDKIFERVGKTRTEIDRIVIAGGGRTAQHIASHFLKRKESALKLINFKGLVKRKNSRKKIVRIIEKDYERCKTLSSLFPESIIIHADLSDENVFTQENLNRYDLVIAATENQEFNILTAAFAKKIGIKKAVCLVHSANYANLASKLEIDVVINSKNSIVQPILRFIRKGKVRSIYSVADSDAEIVEFVLTSSSILAGQKVQDIKFPENTLLIAIIRESNFIIPNGLSELKNNDRVIILTRREHMDKLEEMAAGK